MNTDTSLTCNQVLYTPFYYCAEQLTNVQQNIVNHTANTKCQLWMIFFLGNPATCQFLEALPSRAVFLWKAAVLNA